MLDFVTKIQRFIKNSYCVRYLSAISNIINIDRYLDIDTEFGKYLVCYEQAEYVGNVVFDVYVKFNDQIHNIYKITAYRCDISKIYNPNDIQILHKASYSDNESVYTLSIPYLKNLYDNNLELSVNEKLFAEYKYRNTTLNDKYFIFNK